MKKGLEICGKEGFLPLFRIRDATGKIMRVSCGGRLAGDTGSDRKWPDYYASSQLNTELPVMH